MAGSLILSLFVAAWQIILYQYAVQVLSSDPDPVKDFCVADLSCPLDINGFACKPYDKVTIDDFVFSGLNNATDPTLSPSGGIATFGDVNTYPALNTQGFSFAQLDYLPGGLVSPHSHPRASEFVYIREGGPLYAGFIDTGNKAYAKLFYKGEVMLFPRGLIHWQLNVGKCRTSALAVLNSQKPGFQLTALSMFGSGVDPRVLSKAFHLDDEKVEELVRYFTPLAPVFRGN